MSPALRADAAGGQFDPFVRLDGGDAEITVVSPSVFKKKIRPSTEIGEALYCPLRRSFHLMLPVARSKQRAMPSSLTVNKRSSQATGQQVSGVPCVSRQTMSLRLRSPNPPSFTAKSGPRIPWVTKTMSCATVGPVTVRPPTMLFRNHLCVPVAGS